MEKHNIIRFKKEDLVENEKLILSLLKENYSINKIAKKTGLKKFIIKAHVTNLMQKLQVKHIYELLKY